MFVYKRHPFNTCSTPMNYQMKLKPVTDSQNSHIHYAYARPHIYIIYSVILLIGGFGHVFIVRVERTRYESWCGRATL